MSDGSAEAPGDKSRPPVGLNKWERRAAGIFGLVAAGAGGAGVFLSENQAGTTTILLVGAVFLLIGIQGTRLSRATKESVEFEASQAVERVEFEVQEQLSEGRPDEARAALEGAVAARPELIGFPAVQFHLYQLDVYEAVSRAMGRIHHGITGPVTETTSFNPDGPYSEQDILIILPNGKKIGIEVKRTGRPVHDAKSLVGAVDRLRSATDAGLLVTNRPPGKNFTRHLLDLPDHPKVEHTLWADESDDQLLVDALERLITSVK